MKIMMVLFLSLFSIVGFADYKVVSLYTSQALLTERYLPFKVYNSENQVMDINGVLSSDGCDGMSDPYNKQIGLVYCADEVTANLTFLLSNGSSVPVGGFEIRKLSIINVVKPIVPVDPKLELGGTLYVNNCTGCHSSKPIVSDVAGLKGSFGEINQMNSLLGKFTDEELDAMIYYIQGGTQ